MDRLDAMHAFTRVVTLGSYAEAARALGLTRSAVSKAVAGLEARLGVRLLERTTRRVAPTEVGLAYHERCAELLGRLEESELLVARLHAEPRGVLKINAPVSFGALHLGPLLAEFLAAHPAIRLELTLTDRFVDPVEEGVDVTIRIAALEDSSLIARRLAPARRVLVAAPVYLAAQGEPVAPEDLVHHRCLTYGHSTTGRRWRLLRDGRPVAVPAGAVLCSNNGDVLRAAALAGQGITLLPTFLVGPDIEAGRLRPVLPGFPPTALAVSALYTASRYLAAKTRAVIDFLAARLGERPAWDRFLEPPAAGPPAPPSPLTGSGRPR